MRRLLSALILLALVVGGTARIAHADPMLPLPRMPICGDQDGSETPLTFRCATFTPSTDVQTFQAPGSGPVDLRFDFVFREATYNNELGYFKVDNAAGAIEGVEPGEPGYLLAATQRATIVFPSGSYAQTPDVTLRLTGGDLLVFFIVQDGTLANFIANNPRNEVGKYPRAFFALDRLNPDGVDHFVGFQNTSTNYTQFGFEDLTYGGDRDYDDIVYDISPPLQPLTGRVDLSPATVSHQVGETHTLVATVTDMDGAIQSSVPITFTISGANSQSESMLTDGNGKASFSYQGANAGLDTIVAYATLGAQATPSNSVTAEWTVAGTETPLIFIPGISGSYLDEIKAGGQERRNLWLGALHSHKDLVLDPDRTPPTIIATDVIRQVASLNPLRGFKASIYENLIAQLIKAGYREYKVNADPGRRTYAGCDMTQAPAKPTLFVMAYDWRQKNEKTAIKLKEYIDCIHRFYPGSKVDIVTHSMGGLVARRYILQNPHDNYVNKLITIAAPWLGAPKAINVLETGQFDIPEIVVTEEEIAQIAQFASGAHELLPSKAYFDIAGSPFHEDGWDVDISGNKEKHEEYSPSQLVDMLNKRYPLSKPGKVPAGSNSRDFHDYRNQLGWSQDDWQGDESGVRYYHIYSKQAVDSTIGEVRAIIGIVCHTMGSNYACWQEKQFVVNANRPGDGTVPLLSASRYLKGQKDLNSSTATLVRCTSPHWWADDSYKHSELASNSSVIDYVLAVLKGRQTTHTECKVEEHSQPAAAQQPAAGPQATSSDLAEPPSEPAYYLGLTNAISVTVADSFGNSTAPISDTFSTPVPGVTEHLLSSTAHMIVLATGQTYVVTLRSGAEPLAIEITRGTSAATTQAIRYQDLALPPNVMAMLTFTPQGVQNLRYDKDGNGSFETAVAPTIAVSGSAAQDEDPPTIAVTRSGPYSNMKVVIAASDSGTGVKSIFYSLDGSNFERYTTPLQVNISKTPVLYAFADDNVANRSSLVTYQLAGGVYIPAVRR